ncbi:hypothetical protein M3I53_35625 [Paraburkholderia sp. CNPSo 3272]|uniref:cyclic-phosphate processing receiver domain-containing protein n=1 Tax=Paraburkholderia sp. CNPSo 3272 TaxID=2940931 RepID=UPI0020B8D769|nr:cyclic-phosphate processing receiver domain-containing protein [Paraburkholderia sp. CNPSo 3272]MCP3728382.1 hypothetical protein [Paraburkholderia sp. CNPSo 3272]
MKVFLDDERPTPKGWLRVYWPDEAIRLLESGIVEEISLDHDLGDDDRGTGYDVILWIEEVVALHDRAYQGQPTGWSLTAENDRGRSNDCA